MRHIENPGIVRTSYSVIFKQIQGHSVMFNHIEGHYGSFQGSDLKKYYFLKTVKSLATVLFHITFIYFYHNYLKNLLNLDLFKIVTLNLTILACSLKMYVIGNKFLKAQTSLNPILIQISFTIREYSFHLYNCKKTTQSQKITNWKYSYGYCLC